MCSSDLANRKLQIYLPLTTTDFEYFRMIADDGNTTDTLYYKIFENNKRQRISFHPQRWHIHYRNHHACSEKLWFVRRLYPNLPQMGQKFYHGMLMPLHDSMRSFMNFRRVLDLLEFKNQASQCFAGNQRCPGVRNSFPFLAWDQSMRPRTHIRFFNQFICTGACACSSNLNYAHKCIENSVNA